MSLMQLVNGTWVTVTRHICPPGEGLTHSLECILIQHTTDQGDGSCDNLQIEYKLTFCFRMVVCDDHDFSRDMIGYDLRRNESVTTEYKRRFAPNMYTKVSL